MTSLKTAAKETRLLHQSIGSAMMFIVKVEGYVFSGRFDSLQAVESFKCKKLRFHAEYRCV